MESLCLQQDSAVSGKAIMDSQSPSAGARPITHTTTPPARKLPDIHLDIVLVVFCGGAIGHRYPLCVRTDSRGWQLPYRHVCGQHAGLLLLCRVDRLLGRRFPVRRTFQRTCQSRTRHGRMRWFVYDVDTRAGRFYRNPRRSGGGRHCLSAGDVCAWIGLRNCRRMDRDTSGRLSIR